MTQSGHFCVCLIGMVTGYDWRGRAGSWPIFRSKSWPRHGPGHVQRAIRALIDANPDGAWLTAELCRHVYESQTRRETASGCRDQSAEADEDAEGLVYFYAGRKTE